MIPRNQQPVTLKRLSRGEIIGVVSLIRGAALRNGDRLDRSAGHDPALLHVHEPAG